MGGDRPQAGLTAGDPAGSARPRLSTGARARDMAVDAGAWVMSGLEWWLLRSSQIPTTAFLDRGDFPWATTLEEHWRDIRADLDTVLARHQDLPNFQDILRDVAPISQDDRWKTFFFTAYGYRVEANLAACPRTACLLEAIPGLVTAFFFDPVRRTSASRRAAAPTAVWSAATWA